MSAVKSWIAGSKRIVGFSGAGISTASGIPDFRSPQGVWAKNRTIYFQEFLESETARQEYWRQKSLIWPEMRAALPNAGHQFFCRLHEQGKLLGMITQNIDRLHQRAGLPDSQVIELHGNTEEVRCLSCNEATHMDAACARIAKGDLAPCCTSCGGILKPLTVSFGQVLPIEALERARSLCEDGEVFLAVGSSLVVHPAAGFPMLAKQRGAKLIIVNRDETPLDPLADAVFRQEITEILPQFLSL